MNLVRMKCPHMISEREAQSHLRDWLYHGIRKNLRNSLRYLYNNSRIKDAHLMIAAQKAEYESDDSKGNDLSKTKPAII